MLTVACLLLFGSFLYLGFTATGLWTMRIVLFFIFGVPFLVTYALSTRFYTLDDINVSIVRPIGSILIPIRSIKGVSVISNDIMGQSLKRRLASGGVFGYFGKFWCREFGNMSWYATRRDQYVMIETVADKKIVLTPDDLDFVDRLKNSIESRQR